MRWLTVLLLLTVLTGLTAFGVIPSNAAGLARILLIAYAALLAMTALISLARR